MVARESDELVYNKPKQEKTGSAMDTGFYIQY